MQSLTDEPIFQNRYEEDSHQQRYRQYNGDGIREPLQEVVYHLVGREYQREEGDADDKCGRDNTLHEFARRRYGGLPPADA